MSRADNSVMNNTCCGKFLPRLHHYKSAVLQDRKKIASINLRGSQVGMPDWKPKAPLDQGCNGFLSINRFHAQHMGILLLSALHFRKCTKRVLIQIYWVAGLETHSISPAVRR